MDIKEIQEGNKLIAEFMGLKANWHDGGQTWTSDEVIIAGQQYSITYWRQLQYHSSWDWLMPVCKKLDWLAENKTILFSSDYEDWCDRLEDAITRRYEIEPVWKTVIEFIEWYNSTYPSKGGAGMKK